ITWTGGSASPGVVIDNAGTLSAMTRGIDTSGSFSTGSFTLTNEAGATLVSSNNDAFRINTNISSGTITVDNSGIVVSGALDAAGNIIAHASGQALDFAAITSPTAVIDITNHTGAVIGSSGDDAIRPGAGAITIDNDGLIDATASASRAINLNTSSLASLTSFTLDNHENGIIQSQGDTVRITASTLSPTAAYTVTVDNAGTLQSTGATGSNNGQAIDFNDLVSTSGTIHLTNEATGLIQAADADAIRGGVGMVIDNSGRILGHASPGDTGNDGIDFQANGGGVVNNHTGGLIEGARHGITGSQPLTVTNDVGGRIVGDAGSGINLDTAGTTTTTVANHGLITGHSNGTGDGDGVDVDGLVALTNDGTITATGHTDGELAEALAIGGGTIVNHGTIDSSERAITVDDSNLGNAFGPTTIDNDGVIHGGTAGAISITDTFADTITNKGTIDGSIALGGGDDTLNDYAGSTFTAAIDGGDGVDTFHLLGTGAGTLAHAVNFELLEVQGGTWTVSDTESFSSGITVAAGAALTIGDGGSLGGAVIDNGVFGIAHSDVFVFGSVISGSGAFDQAGTGTTVLTQANSYSGGTLLHAGTLELAALGAAGSGAIAFEDGAQTLRIDHAALDHGHLGNTIEDFGAGDTIDLAGIGKATQAVLSADNVLTISGRASGTITLQLDSHAYASGFNFELTSDGHGGTNVTVTQDSLVEGTDGNNLLIAKLLSPVGSFLEGKGGNDILIGGQHGDVLDGGGGNDFLYAGQGADQFRFNGTDEHAGQHATDTVFDLNFAKGDSLVFYDYEAGTFATTGAHPATVLDTGEGAGSGAVVTSMAALAGLVSGSAELSAHRTNGNDLALDISQGNGSHETIVLDHQWQAYAAATHGYLLS
ncbi:MAG TPA: autotransporter-associated beta strand repeat-containing protein, partial [Reyranella sp.]|nr:autotransporter-associated beta strand repeat-containing protein [Reyranella sp.]